MNFQVSVLKILVSYPGGSAVLDDLKRDMAILATSGPEWAERTRRLAARMPGLDIFSQGLVEREGGCWKITSKGRAALESMETRPSTSKAIEAHPTTDVSARSVPSLHAPTERPKRRHERRARRHEARERGAGLSKALARRADDGLAASQSQIHVSSSDVAATAA